MSLPALAIRAPDLTHSKAFGKEMVEGRAVLVTVYIGLFAIFVVSVLQRVRTVFAAKR